jgi:hypothetical protein
LFGLHRCFQAAAHIRCSNGVLCKIAQTCVVSANVSRGPQYANARAISNAGQFRRVGYTYYTNAFADALIQEALVNHGRIRTLVTKLARSMIGHGSSTTTMLPTDVAHWLKLLEDVVNSPAIQALSVLLRHECFLHEEFEHISMDATIRILRRTCGQADYKAKAEVRQAAVITDEEAKRRVLNHGPHVCGASHERRQR